MVDKRQRDAETSWEEADSRAGEAEGGGTVLRWSQLAYNGVEDGRAAAREEGGEEADGEGAAVDDEERCPVCFCR